MFLLLQNREAARCPPREQDQISDCEVGVSSPGLGVSVGQPCSGLADRQVLPRQPPQPFGRRMKERLNVSGSRMNFQ